MTAPVVFASGQRLELGQLIGRGGEGDVYAVRDVSNLAVKVYTVDPATREQKITAMVAAQLHQALPVA